MSTKDPGHSARRDTELGTEPVLSASLDATLGQDGFLDIDRGLGRAVVRAGGAVVQPCLALLTESFDPAVRALARDTLGFRGMGNSPALLADPVDEKLPATDVQPGITVGHEDLRKVDDLDIAHHTRRSSLRQQHARSVTNLLAEYT